MLKSLSVIVWCIVLECTVLSQGANIDSEARSISEQATQTARAGKLDEALQLYRTALTIAPDDIGILRDYAVTLGWAEQYPQAVAIIKKITAMQNDQPDWALREFARSYLFGNSTDDALRTLNQLVERGDYTEQTLTRRALALRWLNRNDEAQLAYADILQRYPGSTAGYSGLAFAQADQGRLSEALRTLDAAPQTSHDQADIIGARIQLLNWMGRHYEAQRLLASLSPELADTRDMLRERIAAARWGGNPSGAMHDLIRLASLYPDQSTRTLLGELRTEYGHAVSPVFRFSKDSDGLIDRTASSDASFHINPANVIRIGYQYRWLEQQDIRTLVRYDLGWSATPTKRVSLYTSVSSVDYRSLGLPQKVVGDGSVSVAASDALRLGGGGGMIVMDAFQAIPKQVTANFAFGEFGLRLGPNLRLQSRYSRFAFSNDVNRDRLDTELTRAVLAESAVRLSVGFRSNLMWHDAWTPDFYSPSRLQSYFVTAQPSGRLTSWMDVAGDIAGGWQTEQNSPVLHPFQATGKLIWHCGNHWRTVLEASKSTSSVDRIGPGLRTYSRWSASAGVEVRFP